LGQEKNHNDYVHRNLLTARSGHADSGGPVHGPPKGGHHLHGAHALSGAITGLRSC